MPGATYYQSTVAYYGVAGSGGNLPVTWTHANIAADIGLACFISTNGTGPSGVPTDGNSNLWYPEPAFSSGVFIQWFVCPVLKQSSSPVTVTIPGCTADAYGGPILVLLEYSPPLCPIGAVAIHAFQPEGDAGTFCGPQLSAYENWNANMGAFYSTLIAVMYDQEGPGGTARTWSLASTPATAIASGVRQTFIEPSSQSNGCVADCVVPYYASLNDFTFAYAPSSPVIDSGPQLHVVPIVITTQS
jgi:hypothetical protein